MGNFLDIGAGLTGLLAGDAQWGDFDNDGDLDILASGSDGTDIITVIFQNDGNNNFSEIDPGFIGVALGSTAWGDYNNDGSLDVLITGVDDQLDVNTVLYDGNDDESNSAPDLAPVNLNSIIAGNQVSLSWNSSSGADDFTPNSGLTYNLYAGTAAGGSDIVAGLPGTDAGCRAG